MIKVPVGVELQNFMFLKLIYKVCLLDVIFLYSSPCLIQVVAYRRDWSGIYPAGATTKDLFAKCLPVLEEMVQQKMPLLVSSEDHYK